MPGVQDGWDVLGTGRTPGVPGWADCVVPGTCVPGELPGPGLLVCATAVLATNTPASTTAKALVRLMVLPLLEE